MPRVIPHSFDAPVIWAGFVGEAACFALGDGTVRLERDGASTTVVAHDGAILTAALLPKGQALLTAGDDGRVVEVRADGTSIERARQKGKWIDQLAVAPDGTIAYASGRSVWVVLAPGKEKLLAHERAVNGLAFAPKGLRLATATYDMARLFYPGTEGKPTDLVWKGSHIGVVFSPDGRYVVSTMQEMALHGWRMADAKHMRMTGYPAKVRSFEWTVGGKWLATSGAAGAILWPFTGKDGPMGQAPKELAIYSRLSTRVAAHPSEDVVATGFEDGLILASRIEDQADVVLRKAEAGAPITAMAWDAPGIRLAFGAQDGAAGVVDLSKS